ncbi:amino acid adenylation domain protein [Aspergillus niger]|uniref:Amino acid adenylation domain protein n=1 Tax=Aspergillus niger TaxID=5061 RepID=A0A505IP53_ASPNG|nr:amino acid adenylation domain protein [Aspergillus niger]
MEALDRIPYELLSIINAYAADWVSLESLLQDSPRVGEIFSSDANTKADYEAVHLVESILQENPVMRHELHCHFRMALKLRQPSLKSSSLTDFISQDHSSSLMTSTSSICPGKLEEMVSVAANIQRLACACLTTLLGRVRKVQPRCWKRRASDGTEPYQPREAGSPTWIEEYRVYRALWNLQLYADLSTAGKRLGWLHDDLENWWFGHMRWDEVPVMVGEEVRTVSECLETLCEGDPVLLV